MQNSLYLQVSDRKKYVDFSALYPELLAKRYAEYILYHKQRKSKTESSLYTEAKMIRYLFDYLQQIGISDLSHRVSLVSAPTGRCVENMIKKHKNPVFMSNRHILLTGGISKPLNQTLYAKRKTINLY